MTVALKSLRPRAVEAISLPSPAICYVAASGALFAAWVGFYLFDPFGYDRPLRDTWHHVAVLRELMAHPFAPSNPHIPTAEASRYFTPISLLAALVGRALALSPYALLGYLGAVSLIGLAAGCWSFGRRYFGSPWAPLALLLSLMFAWGDPSSHAGFHNYGTWISSAAYPSSLAFVFGLFFWTSSLKAAERRSLLRLLGLAIFAAVVLLTHQLSGAIAVAGAGSFILFHPRASAHNKAACLTAIGLGCLATLAWPYFSIVDVLASTPDDRWQSAFPEMSWVSTAMVSALIPLAGIIGFRKPSGALRLELVVPTATFIIAYVVFQAQGSAIAHRLPPAFMLFGQLGIVWMLLDHSEKLRAPSYVRMGVVATLSLILLGAFASINPRLKDLEFRATNGHTLETAQQIAAFLPAGSVSYATESIVFPLQSTGRRVVSIPRPEPVAPSLPARQEATDRFFDAHTDQAERLRLIERWGATHAVFRPLEMDPDLVKELRALGPSRRFQPDIEVVKLDRPVSHTEGRGR